MKWVRGESGEELHPGGQRWDEAVSVPLCLCVVSVYKWSGISTVSEDSLPSMHERVSLLEKAEISPVFGQSSWCMKSTRLQTIVSVHKAIIGIEPNKNCLIFLCVKYQLFFLLS